MFALLFLAAGATADGGARTFLFVLLVVAIMLILVGAIIAIITMYFHWRTRLNKVGDSASTDTELGE
ncbi:MAG: hypothetical protein NVS2B12_14930 [Ktedonobacteraceae bacterium]